MSLILEGIDLPEKGMKVICLFPHGAEELVVMDANSGATAGRPYQAIQIPERHGKLIPLEDVFRAFPELEPYRQGLTGLTILEAEGE